MFCQKITILSLLLLTATTAVAGEGFNHDRRAAAVVGKAALNKRVQHHVHNHARRFAVVQQSVQQSPKVTSRRQFVHHNHTFVTIPIGKAPIFVGSQIGGRRTPFDTISSQFQATPFVGSTAFGAARSVPAGRQLTRTTPEPKTPKTSISRVSKTTTAPLVLEPMRSNVLKTVGLETDDREVRGRAAK